MGWVGCCVQAGVIITGSRRTRFSTMRSELPLGPMTMLARTAVTGTPCERSVCSTSRRDRRCLESTSPSGTNPPRYTMCFTPQVRAARAKLSARMRSKSAKEPWVSSAEASMECTR